MDFEINTRVVISAENIALKSTIQTLEEKLAKLVNNSGINMDSFILTEKMLTDNYDFPEFIDEISQADCIIDGNSDNKISPIKSEKSKPNSPINQKSLPKLCQETTNILNRIEDISVDNKTGKFYYSIIYHKLRVIFILL